MRLAGQLTTGSPEEKEKALALCREVIDAEPAPGPELPPGYVACASIHPDPDLRPAVVLASHPPCRCGPRDRSAARGLMSTRGLYVFEHESALGNAPAHQLFERIDVKQALLEKLEKLTGKQVQLNILEVKNPEIDAQLISEDIAEQLQKRSSFRRTIKRALDPKNIMNPGKIFSL